MSIELAKAFDPAVIYRLGSRNLTLISTRIAEKEKTEHGNLLIISEAGLAYDLRSTEPSSYSYSLLAEAGVAN